MKRTTHIKKNEYTPSGPTEPQEPINPLEEMGVAGVKVSHGFVYDEYLPQLRGAAGRKMYREMTDNNPVIGAVLFAISMLIRSVNWEVRFDEGDDEHGKPIAKPFDPSILNPASNRNIKTPEDSIAFVEGILFDDMDITWDDFISQVLSMLTYGWQYSEIMWKMRKGPDNLDPNFKSIFSDGLYGIRKFGDRSQETIDRWDMDGYGNVYGMVQNDPNAGGQFYIPLEKAVLFKTQSWKDSPEGRSILRTSYRPYFFLKNTEEIEAIGLERNLNGFPVLYAPGSVINGKDADSIKAKNAYTQIVRDVKFNEQGGLVLPSDTYPGADGNPGTIRKVELELLSAQGPQGGTDTTAIKKGYEVNIARSVLAQFIMETDVGSQARSKNETNLFQGAIQTWVDNIATTVNKQVLTKIWEMNSLDPAIMPYVSPGRVREVTLEELSEYVKTLTGAGVDLLDVDTQNYLRGKGDLPDMDEDAVQFYSEPGRLEPEEPIKPVEQKPVKPGKKE